MVIGVDEVCKSCYYMQPKAVVKTSGNEDGWCLLNPEPVMKRNIGVVGCGQYKKSEVKQPVATPVKK